MLKITKSITLTGNSMINGAIAESYQAVIDSNDPKNMSMNSWQSNRQLYKENRTQCRLDAAEFEDTAYALQDEMIAALEPETLPDPETEVQEEVVNG